MQPPSGNITFLFTDIERSSQLWETHPQTMGRSLAQHDQLVRAAFERYRGYVFKTAGDAFFVAFNSAFDALNAAIEAQRRLAAAAWEDTGPLRVRMALHSGEAEERDGDYFGTTLNRTARVLSTAHGGQMLLSRVAAELVWDKLPVEITLRDLGVQRLKDLSRPERIYQLVARDLPAEFPPLRSMELLPNNLPAQVTSFIGRGREIAECKRLLDQSRLLTLTGPGGTGKTRLSLQLAAELVDRFPQGVWLVELATVAEPAQVPVAIANAVDVRVEHGRAPLETVMDALRARQLLLVLDNCEHLIEACANAATALLRRCPKVRIVASSREALNIQGEAICPVPPLTVPEWHLADHSEEKLAQLDAVRLFVDRATAVRPDFALTRANAELIARICWRLDGIPLAIELAAARVKVLSLEQILVRLDDRFRLLSGGSRTALPRQQTLGALIDWSYDLISEPERALLRRLSVFVAGRTLEMAERVCAGEGLDANDMIELLSALVEKSLLAIEPGYNGETRYTMLESVWDYADDKLAQHGETARYRRKHLEYFVELAEGVEASLTGPDQKSILEMLNFEHYNLNAALRFSAESTETVEPGLRLAGAVERFWEVRGYFNEGYEHFRALLAKSAGVAPLVRAKAEFGAGLLSWSQDRDADARRHFHAAQGLYDQLGRSEDSGVMEALLGFIERNDGHPEKARAHFEKASMIAGTLRSDRILARTLSGLGSLASDARDFQQARELKNRSLELFRAAGDLWLVALITGGLGRMHFSAGDLSTARRLIREAIDLARSLRSKGILPYALEALADIDAREGNGPKAVRLYGAASALRETLSLDFSTTERITYQAALDQLHRLVPTEEYEREWREGRLLSPKSAVEFALGRTAQPTA